MFTHVELQEISWGNRTLTGHFIRYTKLVTKSNQAALADLRPTHHTKKALSCAHLNGFSP